jgi:ABC-2 type transport system permease protein
VRGINTIIKKELADHFASYRFTIIFALIAMISLITAYMVGWKIKTEMQGMASQSAFLLLFTLPGAMGLFSLVQFVAFFGPLVGLVLGFDTINRERNTGTLSKLLSQPIYRDVVINGKFLAGVALITVMMVSIVLVITALGLIVMGIIPGIDEVWRIIVYLVISIIYISFWLGVAILFSILFRSTATSALAALAVWIFFSIIFPYSVSVIANNVFESVKDNPAAIEQRAKIVKVIILLSPQELYTDATATIIDPTRKSARSLISMGAGPMERLSMARFSGPLPLLQSILIVVPYIISLVALTVVCFAISYAVFMRQEIRSL